MIGTHPSVGREGSEWRVETVHVEQQGAVITLNEGSHTTAPTNRINVAYHKQVYNLLFTTNNLLKMNF
jgi:hypothetical protein